MGQRSKIVLNLFIAIFSGSFGFVFVSYYQVRLAAFYSVIGLAGMLFFLIRTVVLYSRLQQDREL